MNRIFNINNPVWTFIGKLVDVFVLHLVWIICCIPIVTIGASTTALYYALMKDIKDEEAHYLKAFFRSFKQNLKQGIFIGIAYFVIGLILGFALYFYYQYSMHPDALALGVSLPAGVYKTALVLTIIFLILYLNIGIYIFPLLARFDNTTRNLVRNALLMSIRHLGWTILMILIFAAVYFVTFWFNFIPLLLLGYGLVAYLDSYILNHIFEPYIRAVEGEKKETDPDAWTVPEEEETADVPYTPVSTYSLLMNRTEEEKKAAAGEEKAPEESGNAEE